MRLTSWWIRVSGLALALAAWLGSGALVEARAADEWPQVLQRSLPEATQRATRDLAEARSPADRLRAMRRLAEVQALYGQHTELAATLRRIEAEPAGPDDPLRDAERRIYQADIQHAAGQHVAAAQTLGPLRAAAPGRADEVLRSRIELALAAADAALGQRDDATSRLTGLIQQARTAGQRSTEAAALAALADLQTEMRDYGRARSYYVEAQALTPPWALQDLAWRRMGVAQMTNIVGDRQEAFALLEPVLQQFRKSQNAWGEAEALLLAGYFHEKAGRLQESLAAHRQALHLRETLNNSSDIINSLTHLAAVLSRLGRHDEAIQTGLRGAAMADATDSPALQWDAHGTLAQALAALGQHDQAFVHMQKAERALLRLSRLDLLGQTAAIREKFETDRQAMENARLADRLAFERREQQRLTLTVAAMLVLLVLLAAAVIALVRLYWQTRRLARHDGLTHLLNRRQVLRDCEIECERARRHGLPLSVLSFDLDDFKRINDQHGHAVGDRVLREVAQACRAALRRGDLAGRVGGEEFLLVLPHTDVTAALQLAERLRLVFEADLQVSPGWPVTASFGVAGLTDGQQAQDLLLRVDQALYRAKHQGRNRSEVATAEGFAGSSRPALA